MKRGVFRRRRREMPGLNTAALPDLIFRLFTLLFPTAEMLRSLKLKSCPEASRTTLSVSLITSIEGT